jgi:hypothetical protein
MGLDDIGRHPLNSRRQRPHWTHPPRPEVPLSPLLDQLSTSLRARHYSRRTGEAYCLWVRRYVRFHGVRHPDDGAQSTDPL